MSLDFSLHKVEEHEVYSRNITHNLNKMAVEAGIYECLWRPSEHGFSKAEDIILPLEKGLNDMKLYPGKYEDLNPTNGWGCYKDFVAFVEDVLNNAREHPDARIDANI
jgi:hypothetical protein